MAKPILGLNLFMEFRVKTGLPCESLVVSYDNGKINDIGIFYA
jgi:hypothetical protein